MNYRENLKNKKKVVIKVGSASLTHHETGKPDFAKLEVLSRQLSNLVNSGIETILVSSGAIAVGRNTLRIRHKPKTIAERQACAAVGQAKLMMIYQKLFSEYNQVAAQILFSKDIVKDKNGMENLKNTFAELTHLDVIPVVNENDSVATDEIEHVETFGDNDTLSAVVASVINADLLILLSDIDGLYTDDPRANPDAKFVPLVEKLDDSFISMGKESTGSNVGTGGMHTKMSAASIAVNSGIDMVIASANDFRIISDILAGEDKGTLFVGNHDSSFDISEFLSK